MHVNKQCLIDEHKFCSISEIFQHLLKLSLKHDKCHFVQVEMKIQIDEIRKNLQANKQMKTKAQKELIGKKSKKGKRFKC